MVGAFMKMFNRWSQQTWSEITWDSLKQGCKAKDSPCACFCHLLLAADEDSRLNLERLGSLGSTSLLQLLPELLGTLAEDNKAGEDLPQQWEGAHVCTSSFHRYHTPAPRYLLKYNVVHKQQTAVNSVNWDFGETCWAAVPAAQHHLRKSPNECCKTSREQNQSEERLGLRGAGRQNKRAVL